MNPLLVCAASIFPAASPHLKHAVNSWVGRVQKPQLRTVTNKSGSHLELNILDFIGPTWWGDGITTDSIKRILDQNENAKTIRVVIDSPGGSAFDGIGIRSALRRHSAKVTTEVLGLAASAASIIFEAGDERLMHTGTELMVHRASTITWGNDEEHEQTAKLLKSLDSSLVDIYIERTGKPEAEIRPVVNAETWFTAKEAVADNWADRVITESGTTNRLAGASAHSSTRAQNRAPTPLCELIRAR